MFGVEPVVAVWKRKQRVDWVCLFFFFLFVFLKNGRPHKCLFSFFFFFFFLIFFTFYGDCSALIQSSLIALSIRNDNNNNNDDDDDKLKTRKETKIRNKVRYVGMSAFPSFTWPVAFLWVSHPPFFDTNQLFLLFKQKEGEGGGEGGREMWSPSVVRLVGLCIEQSVAFPV